MNGSNEFDKLWRTDLETKPSVLNYYPGWSQSSDTSKTPDPIYMLEMGSRLGSS